MGEEIGEEDGQFQGEVGGTEGEAYRGHGAAKTHACTRERFC